MRPRWRPTTTAKQLLSNEVACSSDLGFRFHKEKKKKHEERRKKKKEGIHLRGGRTTVDGSSQKMWLYDNSKRRRKKKKNKIVRNRCRLSSYRKGKLKKKKGEPIEKMAKKKKTSRLLKENR